MQLFKPDNIPYLRERYTGTIIETIDSEKYIVENIGKDRGNVIFFCMKGFDDEESFKIPYENIKPSVESLGNIFTGDDNLFAYRNPRRQYKQGLSERVVRGYRDGYDIIVGMSTVLLPVRYFSINDAVILLEEVAEGVPLSKHFSIRGRGIFYKEKYLIGEVGDRIRLSEEYSWLEELFEQEVML